MLAEHPSGDGGEACLLDKRFPGKVNPMLFQEVLPALAPLLGSAGQRPHRISPSPASWEEACSFQGCSEPLQGLPAFFL